MRERVMISNYLNIISNFLLNVIFIVYLLLNYIDYLYAIVNKRIIFHGHDHSFSHTGIRKARILPYKGKQCSRCKECVS